MSGTMRDKARDASRTIQERIAATHVRKLDVDVNAMAAISNIFRVAVLFRNTAERRFLHRHHLSFSGFTLLWVLWAFGKMETHQLATECGIAKGTLTGLLNTMEKRGFAERKPHARDGRRKMVHLTRRGAALMRKLFLQINALEREFVAQLQKTEVTELIRQLRIVLHTPALSSGNDAQ